MTGTNVQIDITSSINQKLAQNEKNRNQQKLLAALEVQSPKSPTKSGADLSEPRIATPLWRRVDPKYWWNEHLLGDFIDAGV
jgi:hypothetical protein